MSLPVELRLHISEYVLTRDEPLVWYWSTYTRKRKIGTFVGLDQLTALVRVSQQLHSEIAMLAFKVNTSLFDWDQFGPEYRAGIKMKKERAQRIFKIREVSAAHRCFLQRFTGASLKVLRSIRFDVRLPFGAKERLQHLEILACSAAQTPNAHVAIQYVDWFVKKTDEVYDGETNFGMEMNLEIGYRIARTIASFGLDVPGRNWHVLPGSSSDYTAIKDHLEGEYLEDALRWHKLGI
ncbi:hypothetical protein BDU57DRAFT_512627 [Ampelomyces quisqualis]|uniref:Uncharacterized protein n=1 Tax=Ampelomyces quisqualis TaxID=50730 RepID=A0A6A5QXW7_AMPQU|nr:hypothetical protein BDU57DRAFT_512627 [Ampelomyces quisqualis]